MNKKRDLILKEVLEKITPKKNEIESIKNYLDEFIKKTNSEIKRYKINAEIFVGGSFAKKTLIKKGKYDIDIFLRFGAEGGDISDMTEKILKRFKNVSRVHGSRDYFRIKIKDGLYFEIVPVIKIRKPKDAENITDLSYLHVRYINKKIKSEKILNEIRIAKAFCHANNCYGAESYISGFSGYGLELLVYYHRGFINFIKAVARAKNGKIIIDIEKHHKSRRDIMMDLNSSKLNSPIILIDPTYKNRNVLAALSERTFRKFQEKCRNFLKSPSLKDFEIKEKDFEKMKKEARKKRQDFVLIKITTDKPEGNVAGSKLLKFYRHLAEETSKFFEIKTKEFYYDEYKSAKSFFAVKNKKEILIKGPNADDKKHAEKFKKKHRKIFVKGKKIYARKKIDFGIKKFIEDWKKKNKTLMKDMAIKELKIIDN